MVRTNAHWPNGESAEGEKSRITPPINPKTKDPPLSSSANTTISAARYSEKPFIGKLIRAITSSWIIKITNKNSEVLKTLNILMFN